MKPQNDLVPDNPDIEKILTSREEIREAIERLGAELTDFYQDKNPLVVGVLKGSLLFMADLVREMHCPLELDFMDVSSYGDEMVSSGTVKILKDLDTSVKGRHVLFVEDIVDTGRTMTRLTELFEYREAASVHVVTLLDKPERRVTDFKPDWIGIEIPNEFVVGYGMDYKEQYRGLPYLGILKPSTI
ncbi:MAG: hypoxanthine phosphoribosyltransferase [Aerococcus sp.]|nr:hypoxanthine phosphoribosyltransferase [Aerococcus sp.]